MRIALIGHGKMGKMVEKVALSRSIPIGAIFERHDWNPQDLKDASVAIEFTNAQSVVENIKKALSAGVPIVVGTTGWEKHLDEVKHLVDHFNGALLYAPNFSLGVHLYLKLIQQAYQLTSAFPQYHAAAYEMHHAQKADAPSGTGKAMAKLFGGIEVSSIRVGEIAGMHTLVIDSSEETITLSHQAKGREGFAAGAISAAQWLIGKKGIYTLDHLIDEVVCGK